MFCQVHCNKNVDQEPFWKPIFKGVLTGVAAHCTMTFLKTASLSKIFSSAQNYITPKAVLGTAAGAALGYALLKTLSPKETKVAEVAKPRILVVTYYLK